MKKFLRELIHAFMTKTINPDDYYPFYIQTYVERDVRLLRNIGDLSKFIKFLKLCAGRIGQLLNLSSLANECGISVTAATKLVIYIRSKLYLLFTETRL